MLGADLRRAIDDMAGGNMVPCVVTAMRTTQSVRDRTVLLRESVRPVGHRPEAGSRARRA